MENAAIIAFLMRNDCRDFVKKGIGIAETSETRSTEMQLPDTAVPAMKDRPSAVTEWSLVDVRSDIGVQNVQKMLFWADKGGGHIR